MNVRHLRYFTEVVSAGSLRRASEVLYVTQSALSRAVVELEREFECVLLERDQRGIRLTPHGVAFLERAKDALKSIDAIKSGVSAEKGRSVGHVRLAMPIGVRDRITRPLVKRLRTEYAGLRIDISDGNAHENRAAVLDGSADITVIQELDRGLPLNYRRLYTDPLCLVGPRNAGLSLQKALDLSVLLGRPLLQIRAPNQIRWNVDAALERLGASSTPVMEVSSSLLLLDLVEDGHGYTVLPQSLVTKVVKERRISAAPLGSMKVTWVAAWPKGKLLSSAIRTTLDTLFQIV